VPEETQVEIGKSLAEFIIYDIKSDESGGRIDTTEHPFTTGYYTDVRITTHYHEERFESSIFSILHEGGHALYEQGLPMDWMYQPVGGSSSYGIHESMSRFIENMVGKSPEFWIKLRHPRVHEQVHREHGGEEPRVLDVLPARDEGNHRRYIQGRVV